MSSIIRASPHLTVHRSCDSAELAWNSDGAAALCLLNLNNPADQEVAVNEYHAATADLLR
jgi:hypothetical protein